MTYGNERNVLVWDWPLRAFHWLLVIAIIALFVTGKLGGNWMEWHKKAGYFVLGLIAFRIVWGFVGGHHARFVNFVRGPAAVISYLRGSRGESIGHSPLGALSVVAMLLAVAFQATSGLFANDDILLEGPYAAAIGKDVSDILTRLHKINSYVILALVALHILAIAYYYFAKKNNLVRAMITGRKVTSSESNAWVSAIWLAPSLIVTVALGVYLLVAR